MLTMPITVTDSTVVRVAVGSVVRPFAPLSLLDGVPIRREAAAPRTPLYSLRLGAAVQFRPTESGWHANCPACGKVNALTDLDLQTALDPDTVAAGLTIGTEKVAFLAAWQATVWRRRGGRWGALAAALTGMADDEGRVTFTAAKVVTLAGRCNARTPGLAILTRGLIHAGLLHGGEPAPRMDGWGISTLRLPAAAASVTH